MGKETIDLNQNNTKYFGWLLPRLQDFETLPNRNI